jgi:F420 biosynthesis protein FbiB-like protein
VTAVHSATLAAAFDEVLLGRRSVRKYRADPVSEEDVAAIVERARWAPSPHNSEPWRFVILRNLPAKERLALAMGDVWRRDLTRDGLAPDAVQAEIDASHRRIVEAPVIILACLVAEGLDEYPDAQRQLNEQMMAAHSLGAAVQHIMLAAYARGLGTCWMCAPLFCPETVVAALDLPADFWPQGLITVGYPEAWPKARKRRPMPELSFEVA